MAREAFTVLIPFTSVLYGTPVYPINTLKLYTANYLTTFILILSLRWIVFKYSTSLEAVALISYETGFKIEIRI